MRAIASQSASDTAPLRKPQTAATQTASASTSYFDTALVNHGLVQRKADCACGGGCPRCENKLPIQTKLAVSEPGDAYEQEADEVATKVMRMPEPALQRACATCAAGDSKCSSCEDETTGLALQRKTQTHEDGSTSVADNYLQDLGPGQPLDLASRSFFEPRFGRDFSDVRVHTGAKAAESAAAVNALAYTVGRDVVFAGGRYTPHAASGKQLLAHELAHVVQQTGARSRGLRLSRRNDQQTARVLSQGAVASVQIIVDGTMNATRVGPVSGGEDVSVIIGRLTTINELAQQLLPLWNSATPFTPPGGGAPVAFAPLTAAELARGLLVFNQFRLAIPPAARPPVMTNWKIGMRFPLPILIDQATNEGVLHPDMIRALAGSFDAAFVPLLTTLPAVLPALPTADLRQSVADFLVAEPTTLARGIHLGARAVANAQDSKEFILETFNQLGAGAFEVALEFMDHLVNQDISILAPQAAGAEILARIRALLGAAPAGITPTQQSSLDRANGMLGRVAGVQAMPDPCVPNRKLTWSDFPGAVPASAAATTEAGTRFDIVEVPFQGRQLLQTRLLASSWVRPGSKDPSNLAVNGCQADIGTCTAWLAAHPGGNWGYDGSPDPDCPATIVPPAGTSATTAAQCTTVVGAACTAARVDDSLTRLLPHEQLHFDIPCVLVHKANAARAAGSAVSRASVVGRANTLTTQYDSFIQSHHGCHALEQSNWNRDVADGLPNEHFP